MKNKYLAILLFVTISFKSFGQIDFDKLDKYIEKEYKEWQIPGMAIAVVKDGKVVFSKGYGYRDLENKKRVDKNTAFAIASNSKAFTTTALAMMVDQGKINWDDKVVDYLPWFKSYDHYVTANITVKDLVTHRSGLGTFSGDVLWYKSNFTTKEVIEKSRYLQAKKGFREGFGYQNIMFSAAGMILEKLSGKSWQEFMQSEFLDLLGMTNSTTSVSQLDYQNNVSKPYHVIFDEKAVEIDYLNWDNCSAAAGINSSVADMSKWILFQLDNGKLNGDQIVSETQIWELRKLQTPVQISEGAFKRNPGKHFNGYGMGWNVFDLYGKKVIGHGGGSEGMISKVTMIPEENFGFVILTNSINYLPSALNNQILDMYFGKESTNYSQSYLGGYLAGIKEEKARISEMKKTIKNAEKKLNINKVEYKGTYTDKAFGDAVVEIKNGKMFFYYKNAPKLRGELQIYMNDIFAFEFEDNLSLPMGTIQFFRNNKGEISSLEVNIPNPDFFFDEFHFVKQ
jgi:CubicO group peptidase (beta-lactamase class C family)